SDDITTLRRTGNAGLNGAVNLLFSTRYTDLCYGFNAFTRECLEVFDLPPTDPGEPQWGDGFEIETMINIRVARSDAVIREVASFEHERRSGNSNLNTFRDGFRVLRTIWSERWQPATTLTRRALATTGPIPHVTGGIVGPGEDGRSATHGPDQPGSDGSPMP
ncbi:MAG: glycosyltransferase family 2 protein, partial [Cellulomonas sp.]|nr:glycosyltransferase family 2 protein [Cellulomonas sp.]